MRRFFKQLRQRFSREDGVSMAEYALLLALIAVAVTVAVVGFRGEIVNAFTAATTRLQDANTQAGGAAGS